jgi:hypothetical protein
MNGDQHAELRRHLFPSDGKEAAAIVLCGRRAGSKRHRLLARKVHLIPFEACETRSEIEVTWPTDVIVPMLEEADRDGLSVIKIHSHPGGFSEFSAMDDLSDKDLFPCIAEWCEQDVPHASAVMLPDGRIFGRVVHADGTFEPLAQIAVIGDDWGFWRPYEFAKVPVPALPAFAKRHAQAFGERTTRAFQELSIAVIGCSGTGSPTIAQLAHLGVKRLVLVDPDRVHDLNLNRILYATAEDAQVKRLKVDVVGDAINRMGLGADVEKVPHNLCTREAVHAVAECDVIVGCVDSAEGRFLANLIANFYVIPYIDAGVTIEIEENSGEISQVCGYVHCLTPGGSSLLSRQAITLEDVRADGMKRQNPAFYEEQRRAGYIKGVDEDRPAVISVNMQFAALAVNELISRLHPFRERPNRHYAKIGLSLMELAFYPETESAPCGYMSKQLGKGDVIPPLYISELSERTP